MKKNKYLALLPLAGALFSTTTQANDIGWSGFATLAGGATTSSDEELHGYDDDITFSENSLLGLQANANIGNKITAVGQIVARGKDSWNANFEWAYVGYQATDNFKILVGRQRVPFYKYSDYLDVSYAYHWITPPEETYASTPFNTTDGIGLIYTNQIGPIDSTFHFVYGGNTDPINLQGAERDSKISNLTSLSWTAEYEWLNFRAGYSRADIDIDVAELEVLTQTWASLGTATGNPEWANFSDPILANDGNNTGDFLDLAITIDHNDYLVIAEYTKLTTDGTITPSEREGYYVSLGKHFGDFMPHITYGSIESTPSSTAFLDDVKAQLGSGAIPSVPIDHDGNPDTPEIPLNLVVGGTVAATEGAFGEPEETTYLIVGIKWDFHPSVAFKLDYQTNTNELNDNSSGLVRFALVSVF